MNCERCGGFTVQELVYSREQARSLLMNRCWNCGHRFGEPVIDFHHLSRAEPVPENPLPVYRGIDYWGEHLKRLGKVC